MRLPVLVLLLALTACAGGRQPELGRARSVECAPFARALTRVDLAGPADSWWGESVPLYPHSQTPRTGSLLVFRRSRRLPSGHVSVVSAVLSSREILLTHANWLHGRIGIDQPAIDVSPQNDWTLVRVFWPPTSQLGATAYPTYGFIVPDLLRGHAEIVAEAR